MVRQQSWGLQAVELHFVVLAALRLTQGVVGVGAHSGQLDQHLWVQGPCLGVF
jgi:hypothetical protein